MHGLQFTCRQPARWLGTSFGGSGGFAGQHAAVHLEIVKGEDGKLVHQEPATDDELENGSVGALRRWEKVRRNLA